jgi:hypothetical protein
MEQKRIKIWKLAGLGGWAVAYPDGPFIAYRNTWDEAWLVAYRRAYLEAR